MVTVASSEPVANGGVADRQDEEHDTGGQQNEVEHGSLPFMLWSDRSVKPGSIRKRWERGSNAIRKK